MREPAARYRTMFADSARWEAVALREGDIVISAPQKCGTRWMQTMCALLIFQSPELPAKLDELSIWPDLLLRDRNEMADALDAQNHRRFMKTHTAMDGLPYDDRVTYIIVGRDPRDAGVSYINHQPRSAFPTLPPLPRERFWRWADNPPEAPGLASTMHHLTTAWTMRHRPNVVLVHYQRMLTDLEGTMRRLAIRLGIDVPAARWPALVKAATFGERQTDFLLDRVRIFPGGATGRWRVLLDEDDRRRYQERVRTLATPDLLAWVHQGQPL